MNCELVDYLKLKSHQFSAIDFYLMYQIHFFSLSWIGGGYCKQTINFVR